MDTWFTSDLHLGHERIIELCNRPFQSVEDMNTKLIKNWNDVVDPEDYVYVLGDVAMGKIAETLPLVKELNGHKLLVPGNHDRCWSGHRKVRPKDISIYEEVGFEILENQVHYGDWLLCHFPMVGDSHDEDRFKEHRPKLGKGATTIVHGHVHEKWLTNGKQFNVGVDVWNYRPVNYDELEALIYAGS